jgi:O-antigen ligase
VISGKSRGATNDGFIAEMLSSFDPTDDTGNDRKVLWGLSMKVFEAHPILGAGSQAWGASVVDLMHTGRLPESEVGGDYAISPYTLYERALHNIYYQILSENGLVGMGIFIFILWGFWKNTRALTTPAAVKRWYALGGTEDVKAIALGLESGMVGFLTTGYFYNQLLNAWFYALLIMNVTIYWIVFKRPAHGIPPMRGRAPRAANAMPRTQQPSIPGR